MGNHPTKRLWACVTMVLQSVSRLKVWVKRSNPRHNAHIKFHWLPSSHSPVIKCVQVDIICEEVSLGWFGLGLVRLVMRMRTGSWEMASSSCPPREFEHASRWYYRVHEIRKYEFLVGTYGITSTKNFNDFRPAVLLLWNSCRRVSVVERRLLSSGL
jgi:hypothetical protein